MKNLPLPGKFSPEYQAHYAGIATDGKRHWHLLITAQFDLPKLVWGEHNQDVSGAQSRFDGLANTLAMAKAGSPLAQLIRSKGDFYLPSQAEIALCAATLPQIFEDGYHWSSTQDSRHFAFVQDFEYGHSDCDVKGNEFRAAAVHRIMLGE